LAKPLRVALFTDSFYELNGVGTLCREFASFAQRRELPFCCVHSGPVTRAGSLDSVTTIELKRGFSFALDRGLYCDPFLSRYRNYVMKQLQIYSPDLIHITGPGDLGILGFWISNLLGVPMVASWHTNLHEYAARRVHNRLGPVPCRMRDWTAAKVEHYSFRALTAFYRLAHFVLAPNQTMVNLLRDHTGRPAYRMKHGVDTTRFFRRPRPADRPFCIGWVGRLTAEKNVRAFVQLERELLAAGERDFRMLLVGDGSEREWLRVRLETATLPGFLQGEDLAAAFAGMDVFVFPSRTDTFGLVILEAMASGVPVVLSSDAGTRIGMRHGVEGFLSDNLVEGVLGLMRCKSLRQSMSTAAEAFARAQTWNGVYDDLYETYSAALEESEVRRRIKARTPASRTPSGENSK
jgi:phosphatidylinositol alpha 1,6-mannosyltransferase